MRHEWLTDALRDAARELAIPDDALTRWYDEARAQLEAGARIHDYVRVFALRRVRDRLNAARLR
ncbi:DUF3562 domain-containing protein [Burkholderia sp. FERM BP-3421]|jgi:hypothetical protein|uniref:DUF3562 domain-containing protein n=1 Tax=Burkholderia sp. FERM BP-3421 TaxID=1494466 RepID=UPI0023624D06|nr:DUF3562 domain-containing protein [Burkholderia sp. FERM BP-3421]WDD91527.1 DUF3562 domain-containing protein [Burkholderia sp. FERM BP-3421]